MNTSTSPGSPGSGSPSDADGKQKLIANERIKITALLLNNCAIATLGSGVIVPSVALAYGTAFPQSPYYILAQQDGLPEALSFTCSRVGH